MSIFSGLFGPPDIEKLKNNHDVDGLIKALNYQKDWRVREAAVEALGKIGDARAVDPLIAILDDQEKQIRRVAIEALGKIGNARAVNPLVDAINGEEKGVCEAAAAALGEIRDCHAVDPLITALMDKNKNVHVAAAVALRNIGLPAVDPLITALMDKNKNVHDAAAEVLVKIGLLTVNPLIATFKEKSKNLHDAATEILIKIGRPAVDPLIIALKDKNRNVRESAAEILGKIGDARAVNPLIAAIKNVNGVQRQTFFEALEKLGWKPDLGENGVLYWIVKKDWDNCVSIGAPAVDPLIIVLKEQDTDLRMAAADTLVKIGLPAVDPLISVLTDVDKEVRKAAAKILGEIGNPEAVKPLIAALKDCDNDVQYWAAESLSKIGDPEVVEPLIAAYRDSVVRDSAVHEDGGGFMDDGKNSQELNKLILRLERSSDANEIYDLISEIGKFKNNIKAAKILLKYLEKKNYNIYPHVWIGSNLIEIGNKEIVSDLIVLVKNAKIEVNNPRAISSTISNTVKVIGELGNSSHVCYLEDLKRKILSSNIKPQYQSTGVIAGVVSISDSIGIIDKAIKKLSSKTA